jgi:hypothetical protein
MRNLTAKSELRVGLEDLKRIVLRTANPIKKFGNSKVTKVTGTCFAPDYVDLGGGLLFVTASVWRN